MGNTESEARLREQQDQETFEKAYGHRFKKEEYSTKKPFLIFLVGPSQSGKSSFLKMLLKCERSCRACSNVNCKGKSLCELCTVELCKQCQQSKNVAIGNGLLSCTSEFQIYDVEYPSIFGERGAQIVDTVGFGDTSGELSDLTILSLLHCKLMESASSVQMVIDAVFIFQSCKSTITIKPLVLDLLLLLGDRASGNSAIFLTKGNALDLEEDPTLEEINAIVHQILRDLDKLIPVIDLFTPYNHRRSGKEIIPPDNQMQSQLNQISKFINNKPTRGIDIYEEWEKVRGEVFRIYIDLKKKKENEYFGYFSEKYANEFKKKGFFQRIIFPYSNKKIRSEAVNAVNELYQKKGHLARKATELVIFNKIHDQKEALQEEKQKK